LLQNCQQRNYPLRLVFMHLCQNQRWNCNWSHNTVGRKIKVKTKLSEAESEAMIRIWSLDMKLRKECYDCPFASASDSTSNILIVTCHKPRRWNRVRRKLNSFNSSDSDPVELLTLISTPFFGFLFNERWLWLQFRLHWKVGRGAWREILKLTLKGANKLTQIIISDPKRYVHLTKSSHF